MVAQNGTGTTEGNDRTFKTRSAADRDDGPGDRNRPRLRDPERDGQPERAGNQILLQLRDDEAYGQKTAETTVPAGQSNVAASKLVLRARTRNRIPLPDRREKLRTGGEVKGADRTFTTTGGPVATTGQASEIGETTATVKGVVNPQGQTTKYFFNYGTTTAYGQKTSETSVGTGTTDVNASAQLTGLAPGTAYHFQLVAKSAGGDNQRLRTRPSRPNPLLRLPPTTAAPGANSDPGADTGTLPDPTRHQDHDQAGGEDAAIGRRRSSSAPRSPDPASSAASTQAVQGMPLALHRALAEAGQAQDPGQSHGERPDRAGAGVLQLQGGRREVGASGRRSRRR